MYFIGLIIQTNGLRATSLKWTYMQYFRNYMQMSACLLYVFIMEISQFTFVTASPFGNKIILLEIHLHIYPNKMQADELKYAVSL